MSFKVVLNGYEQHPKLFPFPLSTSSTETVVAKVQRLCRNELGIYHGCVVNDQGYDMDAVGGFENGGIYYFNARSSAPIAASLVGAAPTPGGGQGGGDNDPKMSKSLTAWWVAVSTGITTENGGKLKLVDDTKWDEYTTVLYIRESYNKVLAKLVPGVKIAVITGTPGIGKSLFALWFIYKKVSEARTNLTNIPTFAYTDKQRMTYFMSCYGGVPQVSVYDTSTPIPDYYISDTFGNVGAVCNILNLHVTSTFDDSAANFRNKSLICKEFVLAPFSFDEYFAADGTNTNREELQFKYDIFGGSLRLLRMDMEGVMHARIYLIVCNEVKTFFGGVQTNEGESLLVVHEEVRMKACRVITAALNSMDIGHDTHSGEQGAKLVYRSLFSHNFEVGENTWDPGYASVFMKHLAAALFSAGKIDVIEDVQSILGGAGIGILFERDAHRMLYEKLKSGLIVKSMMKVSGKGKPKATPPIKVKLERKVLIRSIADIGKLTNTDYGMPVISNFPLVDAVVQPKYEFQMTLGTAHKGAVAEQAAIAEQLNDKGAPMMIFVLDYMKNYEHFACVEELTGVEQFKAFHDFSMGDISSRKRPRNV